LRDETQQQDVNQSALRRQSIVISVEVDALIFNKLKKPNNKLSVVTGFRTSEYD